MSGPLVQAFLRDGGKLEDLLSRYAIVSRRAVEDPHLVLLKYNQIASPMGEPLVQECRGIILNEADGWRVVSRPFDKFFNHGEALAAPIDWGSASVQEKLDGSLCQLYWHDGAWRVGTSGTPDASGNVNGGAESFAELFWRVWGELSLALPPTSNRGLTLLFELMTKWNRVVVHRHASDIRLIGVRNCETGEEYRASDWDDLWPTVPEFELSSIADVLATFESMKPLEQEGYVVVDGAFRRVKVKHPGYVALHHMKDGMGPRRALEIIRSGETSEVLASFPEWSETFEKTQAVLDALLAEVAADFEAIRHLESQKDFALKAVKTRCSAALFQMRRGKDAREFFRAMPINSLADLLGLRGADEVSR